LFVLILTACFPERLHGFSSCGAALLSKSKPLKPRAALAQTSQRQRCDRRNRAFVTSPHATFTQSSSSSSEPLDLTQQQHNNSDSEDQHENQHDRNKNSNETYEFWEDRLSTRNFNMDLHNLAVEDPKKAQDALEIMQDMFDSEPENIGTCRPDAKCYNTVIDGWIQDGRPDRAQEVLYQMERVADLDAVAVANLTEHATALSPSVLSYMMVAQGWADDVKDDTAGRSAENAETVLRRMSSRGIEPSAKIWSIVMEGWCKRAGKVRGVMRRAEALLKEMEDAAEATGNATSSRNSVHPNVLTYTSYIGGLARSRESELARKAEAVLERMERFGVEPDMVTYTSVLNCWASAISRRERELSASRALNILGLMERQYSKENYHVKPSLITYATGIKAIGNSLDRNAPKIAEDVVKVPYRIVWVIIYAPAISTMHARSHSPCVRFIHITTAHV
jgi:pentatricopeptide repeat protein